MKRPGLALRLALPAILTALPAAAHDAGLPHVHPHGIELGAVAALAVLAVAVLAWWARRG